MICRAENYSDNTVHYIGNGSMLVYGDGAGIMGIQNGYCAPTLGSFVITERHESESYRKCGGNVYTHDIFIRDGFDRRHGIPDEMPELKFTDFIYSQNNSFIRYIEGFSRLTMKLLKSPYIRCSRYKSTGLKTYKNTVTYAYAVPAGTPYFEAYNAKEECRFLITVTGDIVFDGETFTISEGRSAIIISSGSPEQALAGMAKAFADVIKYDSYKDIPAYKDALIKYGTLNSTLEKVQKGAEIEALAVSLLERQANDGGILSSHALPMADVTSFYGTVKAFAALSLEKELQRLARYYVNLYDRKSSGEDNRIFNTYTALGNSDMIPDINQGRSAAYLLKGLICAFGERKPDQREIQVMKNAFYTAVSSLNGGMAPLSGVEHELKSGILSRECTFQGSAEASILIITACEDFILYCKLHKIRLRDEGNACAAKLANARSLFTDNFVVGKTVSANSLKLEGISKRRKFIYSRCFICVREGAFAPLTWLEKDKNGRYLCLGCRERGAHAEYYSFENIYTMSALCTAFMHGFLPEKCKKDAEVRIKEYADMYVQRIRDIPLRTSIQDILVAKSLALLDIDNEDFCEMLSDVTDAAGTMPSLFSGDCCIGALGDAASTAEYLDFLLEKSKHADE